MGNRQAMINWALDFAKDNSHGYNQSNRWLPDCDCSSFMIMAAAYGGRYDIPTGWGYTGSMAETFAKAGWTVYDYDGNPWDCPAGSILLNTWNHTEMWLGDGKLVGARIDERGQITGGTSGDQTGKEVSVSNYYNYPWDKVLIPPEDTDTPASVPQPVTPVTPPVGDIPTLNNTTRVQSRTIGQADFWPPVTKIDNTEDGYSGDYGHNIDLVAVDATEYRVHYLGDPENVWEVPVYKYDITDFENGVAGMSDKPIDGLAIKDRKYRVFVENYGYLDWVDGYNITDFENGFAGFYGKAIQGIQVI